MMSDILVVDDQDRTFDLCRRAIGEHQYRGPARCAKEALEEIKRARGRVDLVLLDLHFDIPNEDLVGFKPSLNDQEVQRLKRRQGVEILKQLRRRHPDLPVILMTSREEFGLEDAADALEVEEYTYFLDDDFIDARMLQIQISSVLSRQDLIEEEGPIYWGQSRMMKDIRRRIQILALGRLPVVLLGPTGTGKSLLARHFVHANSGRTGRFVSVDLSTLPRDLMAAHLFGSVKGAYTGAVADRLGAFEAADGGTLFLDEVGNLSADAQKMLLTVLQDGRFTRLGDLKERAVDVKLVVATNEDLAARVRDGTFRADLYMRLNPSTALRLPSLAERGVDFERLLAFAVKSALARPHFREMLERYRLKNRLGHGTMRVHLGRDIPERGSGQLLVLFSDRCMRQLRQHSWTGNLREFALVIENALLFTFSELAIAETGRRSDVVQIRPKLIRELLSNAQLSAPAVAGEGLLIPVRLAPADSLNKVAQDCERQYFEALYLSEKGDFAKMAEILLGSGEHARKVQLRFNQLGLKVRDLRGRLS
jgi:DNA-binding NtrC family response regulator